MSTTTSPTSKPRLSFWQIWNMSFGFLGIQFGFALQNANVSRIFETLGAPIDDLAILWVAAPLTGFLVQPIIGHFSDKTWGKLGRRRPYFLVGAILASIALFIMPNSPVLWVSVGMLWIMDASINVAMEPFRAFVGDNLPDEQLTLGFSMQTFFIGLGAVIASGLPYAFTNWFGIPNTAGPGEIPLSVTYSFYIGGAVFILAILWTVFSTKEYTLEELESFDKIKEIGADQTSPVDDPLTRQIEGKIFIRNGLFWLILGLLTIFGVFYAELEKELYVLTALATFFGLLQIGAGGFRTDPKTQNGFLEIMDDLYQMPATMRQLALVQFFSWFALFAMWIYMTSGLTSHVIGNTDPTSQAYNDGANFVGVGFAVYNGVAALIAFALAPLALKTSRKTVYMLCLIGGGIGLSSIYFLGDYEQLVYPMIGVGLAWAGILSMPYAILSSALPIRKMGVYMGIFNIFIVIPQLVAASILGFILKTFFENQPIYALVIGGISLFIAAFLVLFVKDTKPQKF